MEHPVSDFLINVWASIFTLMLFMYAALDGFDLGVGILSILERNKSRQIRMMDGLSGVWDANETWLVLMGGTMFGAFPLAYAAILQSLYIPVLLMLVALIFRGVAFEFRLYAKRQEIWIGAFGVGSLLATVGQGLAIGGLLGGIKIDDTGTGVDLFAWAAPFSLLATAVLIAVYTALGATYLLGKIEGDFRDTVYQWAWKAALMLVILLPFFLLGCARILPQVGERWLSEPLRFSMLTGCVLISLSFLIFKLKNRQYSDTFVWCIVSLLMGLIVIVATYYPFIVPGAMTLHMAASSTRTLEFMLAAVGGLLPFIMGYNAYQYYVFRGRIDLGH